MDEAIQTESQPETQEQQPASFIDSLPEDLRNEPSLKNFTDAGSLAKSFVHAQRMIGADKVALPGKSATDEEWRGVYSKIGMPAEASGYEYEADFDEQEHQSFRAAAHAAGLNVKQAQAMASFLDSQGKETLQGFEEQAEIARLDGEKELRQEYGAALEDKLGRAKGAAIAMGLPHEFDEQGNAYIPMFDEIMLADGRALGDHPFIIKLFTNLADQLGEDTLEGATKELVMTPEEASRQIAELTAQGMPYWDSQHPEHSNHVSEVLRLREFTIVPVEG